MSISETALIYVGSPLAISLVVTILFVGPGELKKPSRYRPGRPWQHPAAWYLPHEIVAETTHQSTHRAVPGAVQQPPAARDASAFGGASGEW